MKSAEWYAWERQAPRWPPYFPFLHTFHLCCFSCGPIRKAQNCADGRKCIRYSCNMRWYWKHCSKISHNFPVSALSQIWTARRETNLRLLDEQKTLQDPKNPDMQAALLNRLRKMQASGIPVSWPMLIAKAKNVFCILKCYAADRSLIVCSSLV